MGQFNHYSSRSDFAPVLCTMTQAKKSLLLLLKLLIIWYYPEEQHWLLGAMLPSSASPPHTAPPSPSSTAAPEPWLLWDPTGLSPGCQSQEWDLCFQQSRTHQHCPHSQGAVQSPARPCWPAPGQGKLPQQGLLWLSPVLPCSEPCWA